MRQLFYYKIRQQFITKCISFFIRKCDSSICDIYYKIRRFYYKMHQLLQKVTLLEIVTVHISKQKRFFEIFKGKQIGSIGQKWVNWVNIKNLLLLRQKTSKNIQKRNFQSLTTSYFFSRGPVKNFEINDQINTIKHKFKKKMKVDLQSSHVQFA